MDILAKIFEWIQQQPDWQSDAFRRIWNREKGKLSQKDIDDLVALVKLSSGIQDVQHRKPEKFNPPDASSSGPEKMRGRLVAIKDMKNVNALAEDQKLSFNPNGLTVIYGENGSGKSGYSRVVKRVFFARAQGDRILPNAYVEQGSAPASASATFMWQIDGAEEPLDMHWDAAQEIPPKFGPLISSVAVFDSQCVRVYNDDKMKEIVFYPYGLDMLKMLGDTFNDIKAQIDSDIDAAHESLKTLVQSTVENTKAGCLIRLAQQRTVNDDKTIRQVRRLAKITKNDILQIISQINSITAALKELNPERRAKEISQKRGQAEKLVKGIGSLMEQLHSISKRLKQILPALKKDEDAANLAAEKFTSDKFLPETGTSAAWRKLFEAARAFSEFAYSGKEFPVTVIEGKKPQCVLCQQPLTECGVENFKEFDEFVRHYLKDSMSEKIKQVKEIQSELKNMDHEMNDLLALVPDVKHLTEEAGEDFPELSTPIESFINIMRQEKQRILELIEARKWQDSSVSSGDLTSDIEKLIKWAIQSVTSLNEVASGRKKNEAKLQKLKDRKELSENEAIIIEAIQLHKCIKAVNTRHITDFEISLSNSEMRQLAALLRKEIRKLDKDGEKRNIDFKPEHRKGKTMIKLMLPDMKHACPVAEVLSEGEQSAIAMAAFFAETSLTDDVSTLVFDDPTLSLDDRRLKKIAQRLRDAAKEKQIIVFTHDMYLASMLVGENVWESELSFHAKKFNEREYGVVRDGIPFVGKTFDGQMQRLDQLIRKIHPSDDDVQVKLAGAYDYLRIAIERFTEDKIFLQVVTRRSTEVQVGILPQVFSRGADMENFIAKLYALHKKVASCLHKDDRVPNLDVGEFKQCVNDFKRIFSSLPKVKKIRK